MPKKRTQKRNRNGKHVNKRGGDGGNGGDNNSSDDPQNPTTKCSKLGNKDACRECVEEWYWDTTDQLKEAFTNIFNKQKETFKLAITDVDREYVNAINSVMKDDKELSKTLVTLYNNQREERRNNVLNEIEKQIRKEFLSELVEIKSDPEFKSKFAEMMASCNVEEERKRAEQEASFQEKQNKRFQDKQQRLLGKYK